MGDLGKNQYGQQVWHAGGEARTMGCLPPRKDFGGFQAFASAINLIPRNKWLENDLQPFAPTILDQNGRGACVGFGSTKAMQIAYSMATGTTPDLSPWWLYALINGGRDAGAQVSDAMEVLSTRGICLNSSFPARDIYARDARAGAKEEAAKYKIVEAYHCGTFNEIGTALTLGFAVSFGLTITHGLASGNFDSDGVPDYRGQIPNGGHCMAGAGLKRSSSRQDRWLVRVMNSWTTQYGDNGTLRLSEDHFTSQGGPVDAFAIKVTSVSPDDPNWGPVVQ